MSGEKNNDFTVGILLKELREKRCITQEEFAVELGYSVRQIRRFENDYTLPSADALEKLSHFFNVDVNAYITLSKSFKYVDSYEKYIQLRTLIENSDYSRLEVEYNKLIDNPDFQSGEKQQLLLYSEGLILANLYKNYNDSIDICFKALDIFNYKDYISSLNVGIINDMSYPVLFLLVYNFNCTNETNRSFELSEALYNHFTTKIFNRTIPIKDDMYNMKKYYIVSTNNLAHMYFELNDFTKSLDLANTSEELSNKFRINLYLHYILQLKFEVYYKLGDINSARKFYSKFKFACEFNQKLDYLNSVNDTIKLKYDLLFVG